MSYLTSVKLKDISGSTITPAKDDTVMYDDVLMRQLLQLLKPLLNITSGTGRLSIDVNGVTTVATITTVSTVSTVSNISNIGGLNGFDLQYNNAKTAFGTVIRNNVSF